MTIWHFSENDGLWSCIPLPTRGWGENKKAKPNFLLLFKNYLSDFYKFVSTADFKCFSSRHCFPAPLYAWYRTRQWYDVWRDEYKMLVDGISTWYDCRSSQPGREYQWKRRFSEHEYEQQLLKCRLDCQGKKLGWNRQLLAVSDKWLLGWSRDCPDW